MQGGHLEFGEDFITCGAREVLEECGVKLSNLSVVPFVANSVSTEFNCHYITIFVRGETVDEPVNMEPEKCEGWEYFAFPSDVPSPRFVPLQALLDAGITL